MEWAAGMAAKIQAEAGMKLSSREESDRNEAVKLAEESRRYSDTWEVIQQAKFAEQFESHKLQPKPST